MAQQQFTDWHRQLAAGVADAHPLESIDRGPLTMPAELSEDDAIAFDLARNDNKGERLARANDAHALDLQVQLQGYIGGLPA